MLARLRNANSAYHETVSMPHSKIKSHIAEILKDQGYIASFDVADAEVGMTLTLNLKYGPSRERSIAGAGASDGQRGGVRHCWQIRCERNGGNTGGEVDGGAVGIGGIMIGERLAQ
jgi:hypothetical protein